MFHGLRVALAVAASCTMLPACDTREDRLRTEAAPSVARVSTSEAPSAGPPLPLEPSASVEPPVPYPPARWRLVPLTRLAPCVLWVSHILVRHEGVPDGRAPFDGRPAPWTPLPPAPSRSRAEAQERADALARHAQREPARYAALARTQSDDVTTREQGGSLGGLSAAAFRDWPQVLDALATLRPGEVSRPVETEFGFHILQRRAPPAEEPVSGRRLIIAYDEARWLHEHLAGRDVPRRPRAEAQALAARLFERARHDPQSFGALVAQYSDHRDIARGGDFGRWSSRERTPFPRTIERLVSLGVGEISPPLETFLGFEIIQRTANQARGSYAFARIQHTVAPSAPPDSARSPQQTWNELERIARVLRRQPERFAEFQAAACCSGVVSQWEAGRDSVQDEQMLAQLAIGQIGPTPVKLSPLQYAIVQRLEPAPAAPEPSTCVELPSPEAPDVAAFFTSTGRLGILQRAQREAQDELGLTDEQRATVERLHAIEPVWRKARTSREKLALLEALGSQLAALLGEPAYSRYRRLVIEHVERALLSGGRPLWQRGEVEP